MNIDDKRNSGRTTTLLRAALQRAAINESGDVVVVVSSYREVAHMVDLMRDIVSKSAITSWKFIQHSHLFILDDKVVIRVLALGNDAINTREFIVRGVSEQDTFFDHHAIESIIGRKAFDLWIRYDGEGAPIKRKPHERLN